MNVRLRPGDLVYRVIEVDPLGTGPHTWKVGDTRVQSASDRQITLLHAHRLQLVGVRFKPRSLGSLFFATPHDAVRKFLAVSREQIASANRQVIEASRALAWIRENFNEVIADG